MAGEYLTMPLNTSVKGWNARWFYMKQSHPAVRCDADHILESQRSWSETLNSADMEQVRELLALIKGVKTNGGLVAASFIYAMCSPIRRGRTQASNLKGRPTVPRRGQRYYQGMLLKSGLQSCLLRLPHSACQGTQSLLTARICRLR